MLNAQQNVQTMGVEFKLLCGFDASLVVTEPHFTAVAQSEKHYYNVSTAAVWLKLRVTYLRLPSFGRAGPCRYTAPDQLIGQVRPAP